MRVSYQFDRERIFTGHVQAQYKELAQEVLQEYAQYLERDNDLDPQAPEKAGVLFAWHIPNPPCKQGYWKECRDIYEAIMILDLLADVDLFFGEEIWANASGVQVFEEDGWTEWEDADGYTLDDYRNDDGLCNGYKITELGGGLKVPGQRFRLIADNLAVALKAIDFLTSQSASFTFEPVPDGYYWVEFKYEQRERLERFMHYEEVSA